jgi:hypothetical protein
LLSILEKANPGSVEPDKIDDAIPGITRYEGWCNLVEDPDSEGEGSVLQGRRDEERWTIIVRPHYTQPKVVQHVYQVAFSGIVSCFVLLVLFFFSF